MNRRGIFKGAAGAIAALSLSKQDGSQAPNYPPPQTAYDAMTRAELGPCAPSIDPLWEIKNAFRQHANAQAQLENKAIDRRIRALDRLQSVSRAYVDFQIDALNKHRQDMWSRLNQLMQSI